MKKSVYKDVLISIIIAISIITLLEGIARLSYSLTRLDKIVAVLEEKKDIFWKVKSNLNVNFFKEVIQTDSHGFRITENEELWDNTKLKVAVMGASPSFGWGVKNSETYSSQVSINSDHQISVKNFSQIGYSSFQGTHLIESILKFNPTHVLISYVINDLDYYRFFYSENIPDKEVKTSNSLTILLRNYVKSLYLPKQIFHLLKSKKSNDIKLGRVSRVSKKDYLTNIDTLVKKIKENGIIPILIKFPVNINSQDSLSQDIQKIQNAKIKRQSLIYNEALDQYSRKNNIDLIDFTEVVRTSDQYLFLDPDGDTIHPNKLGHKLFADKVLEYFKKI
ncbi:SGNH/GDSL hydrolase family protein [Halobacteriovorax sp.]|uniref:SGNH/GDSL hydrolase family protein n=1 Tax=Halobacteriovorax sp. TaxID=2020862 RepID=UPI00356873CD